MRRFLGTVPLLLVLLVSCGEDTAPTGTDPESPGPSSSAPTDAPNGQPELVALVSETGAGGEVDLEATALTSDSLPVFARQFSSEVLVNELAAEVADADEVSGRELIGAVVSIGCDVPPGVNASQNADGSWTITPDKVASPLKECYAPVTTVALVLV